METESTPAYQWPDDLLDRGQYAEFLTKYLAMASGQGQPGMVMALDAPWGVGKTFFIRRWAVELSKAKHHTMIFDAWKNDSTDDPVISFMAALKSAIEPLYDLRPSTDVIKGAVEAKAKTVATDFRRALIPASKVLVKALVKKGLGASVEEFSEAIAGGSVSEELLDASEKAIEAGLDEFFDRTLKAQKERLQAIDDFHSSLVDLLATLRKHEYIEGPLFVFIDELDRCRPDFAIRLLEGIKHLFNVQGVVFIIATNLDQLSKAVGAIYGANFDGQQYLKRFFDLEFTLPDPTRLGFIETVGKSNRIHQWQHFSGLDQRGNKDDGINHAFAVVAESMEMDLRSIQRALKTVDAAVSQLTIQQPILAIWMFFLAALKHRDDTAFRQIAQRSPLDLPALFRRVFTKPQHIVVFEARDPHHNLHPTSVPLSEALYVYCEAAMQPGSWLNAELRRNDSSSFRTYCLSNLTNWQYSSSSPHPISRYAGLIAMAGHIGL